MDGEQGPKGRMPRVARISSRSAVTGLTVAAMAVVCVFAFQAAGSTPQKPVSQQPAASQAPEGFGSSRAPGKPESTAPAVPANSGSGKRVVYALADKRVWLVDGNGKVLRTYPVAPSPVSPAPGTYAVTARNKRITGSDGVPVEHVVIFASADSTVIGFSSAVDESAPTPDPDSPRKTGGIRQSRQDGEAMWKFAVIGVKVVVVP